jgi:hypothetical protein
MPSIREACDDYSYYTFFHRAESLSTARMEFWEGYTCYCCRIMDLSGEGDKGPVHQLVHAKYCDTPCEIKVRFIMGVEAKLS